MEPAAWVGRSIDGRYVIESVLGVGGMGMVFRAKHQFTGVPVAIKVLRAELAADPEIQARFGAEAQAPNAIGHPAIVKVLDGGRASDGTMYMAMELLVGRSMRAAVSRRDLSVDQIKRVMLELLGVLGHAHGRGFVHRDLKPDNVFLCAPADEVKLLDFGIAKMLGDAVRNRTVAGAVLGTPAYMAPEQLADARNVDARADLWAVGAMLYELVTGRLPVPGATPNEIMVAVAAGQVTPIRAFLPHASPALEQFFARALAPDPKRRFGAAIELAQALQALELPIASTQAAQSSIGTMATGVASSPGSTVASVAVPNLPGHASFTPAPMQQAMTAASAAATRPGSSKTLLLVGALAVIAIVIGIAVAVSGGSKKADPAITAKTEPDPAPEPKPVVPPKPDAHQNEERVRIRRAACAERCDKILGKCGTTLPSCVDDCLDSEENFAECFDASMRDCTEGATCGFRKICGKVPSGSLSCGRVVMCQVGCINATNPTACGCDCDAQLHPAHTLALGRFNACVLRAGCTTPQCVTANCPSQAAACR